MDKDILIEKYLAGEATDSELSELKQLMNDETAKQEITLQRLMKGVMRAQEEKDFHEQLNHLSEEILLPKMGSKQNATKEKAKVKNLFPQSWVLAIAATLTLLIVALVVFNQQFGNTSQDLYASYYQPLSAKNVRGTAQEELQANMLKAYNTSDYQSAKPLLEQLLEKQPENAERLTLLLANCLLNLDNTSKVIQLLKPLSIQNTSDFQEDAQWYLALSYLKANQIDEAKELIKEIQSNPNHLYTTKAKQLAIELK